MPAPPSVPDRGPSRRRFLGLAAGGALALPLAGPTALTALTAVGRAASAPSDGLGTIGGQAVPVGPGPAVEAELVAAPTTVDLGGVVVDTWAYGDTVPGPPIRLPAGATLRAILRNGLPERSTVHWHGIRVPFGMDGVPGVPTPAVGPGSTFVYEFTTPDPGTYFFHPHTGLQLDRGLYAVLLVDDPADPGRTDAEWVVVLDDWTDGVGPSPDEILGALMGGLPAGDYGGSDRSDPTLEHPVGGMGVHDHGAPARPHAPSGGSGSDPTSVVTQSGHRSSLLGGHGGQIAYPAYLVNGRVPAAAETYTARPGQRVRLRIVNAGAETAFRVALGGHRLTVTHADGAPVVPFDADAVLVGMGERVDAVVTAGDGAFPLVAAAEGKAGDARAVLRTSPGARAPGRARPAELRGRVATVADLRADPAVRLPSRRPDRVLRLRLRGGHDPYRWTINGKTFDEGAPLVVDTGERVRLDFRNESAMFHPMHLHGHTFEVVRAAGDGPRKDTVVVRPGERVRVDFDADNAGDWMVHCHNAYHQEAGMMRSLYYSGA